VHARLALDGEDDDAAVLANARVLDGLAGKRTARRDRHFADLEIHAEMRGGRVQKTDHVRTQKRMGDALSGKNIGTDHRIGARAAQVLLRHIFAGAGNDAQLRIQAARRQHDIKIGGVSGGGGDQDQPHARFASRRVCSWVASPTIMSQFSLANFCAFASSFSMITN
jgi:hypothetical protein